MTGLSEIGAIQANLEDALKALNEASQRYNHAKAEADAASRDATTALNVLNAAQKEVDKQISLLREGSPRDSDWKRRKAEFISE